MKKSSNQKDWEEFINNKSKVFDKDNSQNNSTKKKKFLKYDFHGYSIEDAQKKTEELIFKCYKEGVKEILIITGKGIHSNTDNDVYVSKEYSKLQNIIPEYIKNNPDILSKINFIKPAPQKLGGTGALIINLKKL